MGLFAPYQHTLALFISVNPPNPLNPSPTMGTPSCQRRFSLHLSLNHYTGMAKRKTGLSLLAVSGRRSKEEKNKDRIRKNAIWIEENRDY